MKIYILQSNRRPRARIAEWFLRWLYGPKLTARQHELYLRRRERWQDDALAFKLKLALAASIVLFNYLRLNL